MPEYLAPGVYVEEVSFRSKSIEGVSTSVTGFVGTTRFGPVGGEPELLTNFADFERIYGGLDTLAFVNADPVPSEPALPNYLALGVRAFFENGGTKLYVTRVYNPPLVGDGFAAAKLDSVPVFNLRARFPGSGGNLTAYFTARLSQNIVLDASPNLKNVMAGDVVFVVSKDTGITSGLYNAVPDAAPNRWKLTSANGDITEANVTPTKLEAYVVTATVSVLKPGRFEVTEPLGNEFSFNPNARNFILDFFVQNPASRQNFLILPFWIDGVAGTGAQVATALLGSTVTKNMLKQGIPFLLPLTVTTLKTLSNNYLLDLGFNRVAMNAMDQNTFTLPELQRFSLPTLQALTIPALKTLTVENLRAIPAGEADTLLNPINSMLLKKLQAVPLERLSLATLRSLQDATLPLIGAAATLKTFDWKTLTLAELQKLSTPTLQKLGIASLKMLTDAQVGTALADATKTTANTTVAALAAVADNLLAPLGLSQAALLGIDWMTLTIDRVQAQSDQTLQQWGLTALKTLTEAQLKTVIPAGTLNATTIRQLADIADAQLTPLGLSQNALTRIGILTLTLSELKDLEDTFLTKIGFPNLKTLTPQQLQDLPEANPNQVADKQKLAAVTGVDTLARIQATHLEALTLPILATLTNAALNPVGLSRATLNSVNAGALAGLTVKEFQTLPESALAKIGMEVLATLNSVLPLKPSDLTGAVTLAGGADGQLPTAILYAGEESNGIKSGLLTFTDITDISIVAAPGSSYSAGSDTIVAQGIANALISHCELMRYRIGVLDMPNNRILSEARDYRSNFDSKYAAMYYPWIKISDPMDTIGRREITVPPSGSVAGIYARNDAEHSVSKAPANEVVRGALSLEFLLNKAQQDILNPDGIDCFRFFPNRGLRLWGARTISSDSEWKYVNVRRYFAYLEHSIDKGSQYAVFENNNQRLWDNVRITIEDFLFNEWRNGNLMGNKAGDAFFVRCDRSTMTQNDIDNGRLVCLIGVAVNKPAEFVIFRIGQMTADSKS